MEINELEKVLNKLPMQEVRERFAQCYGHTPTTRNRSHLIKKILWANQRDEYGNLSEAARKKALAIADDRDVKGRFPTVQCPDSESKPSTMKMIAYQPKQNLLPGTVLHRKYQGKDIRLLVLENGFEWEGKFQKSLSSAARAVTGVRWNGKIFWGVKKGAK